MRCLLAAALLPDNAEPEGESADHHPNTADSIRYGQFEILTTEDGTFQELGAGAMGVTYRAQDRVLRRPVALKVISRSYAGDAATRARFLREARSAAQLRHVNVASVHHYGEQDGQCFYAMELVEGETLEARVRREGPLPAPVALEITLQVARALAAAEAQGIVHRDLKPSNVMLTMGDRDHRRNDGVTLTVKVIDFGLAKAISTDTARGLEETRGGFVGTPAFASPEQFARSGDERIDTRSDIYSLGVTLWYLLCGKLPFVGRTLTEIHEQQVGQPLALRQLKEARVSSTIARLLQRMLAVAPAARPQSARELLTLIERCCRELPPSPEVVRRRRLAMLAGALVLAALAGGWWYRATRPPPDRSVAVLPFENHSPDEAVASFTDGMQDGITGELARVVQLKVIRLDNNNSAYPFGQRDLAKIGRELGVSHLVEGTVRREGEQVQITVRLADIHDRSQEWTKRYAGRFSDSFTIQREAAREITDHLRATLSSGEAAALNLPPTRDPVAYDLYLQTRRGWGEDLDLAATLAAHQKRVALLQQALERDPGFALAYCELAKVHDALYFYSFGASAEERTVDHRSLAEAALQQARRLRPEAGEVHLAEANHFLRVNRDLEQASIEVELARRSLPNSAEVEAIRGRIARRQNRWDDAVRFLERAVTLEPHNCANNNTLAETYLALRRYEDFIRIERRVAALFPGTHGIDLSFSLALVAAEGRADLAPSRRVMTDPTISGANADEMRECLDLTLAFCDRNAEAITDHLAKYQRDQYLAWGEAYPRSWYEGWAARMRGDEPRAQEAFARARTAAETLALAKTTDGRTLSFLALADAALGRKEEAVREARRACELMQPYEAHPMEASGVRSNLAAVYAWTGQPDLALAELSETLGQPTGAAANGYGLEQATYGDLCFNPAWDSLRSDPRFTALVEKTAPKQKP